MSHLTNLLLSLYLLLQLFTFNVINASDVPMDVSNGPIDGGNPINLDHKNNYCLRNITYYEDVAVNKTRQVEVMPTGVLKMFKKSKMQTEYYVDLEKVPRTRLVNECCEGYALADNKTCQPVCPSGCPDHAFCRAPQMCQCRRGYSAVRSAFMVDTYFCEPRCTSGCPHGGRCVAPELCECAEGYQAAAGSCVPTCTSGGVDCVDAVTSSTETTIYESTEFNSNVTDTTGIYAGAAGSGSGNGEDGGDGSDDNDDDDDSNLPFPSKEEDLNCTLQPCIGNTNCKLVDRCACADGFIRHQPAPINGIEVGPICAAVIEQGEPLHDESASNSWLVAFFTIVGVVVMMSALAVLLFKLWRHQRGSLNVEGKNDMCCKYDKNSSSLETGHVDMI